MDDKFRADNGDRETPHTTTVSSSRSLHTIRNREYAIQEDLNRIYHRITSQNERINKLYIINTVLLLLILAELIAILFLILG